MAEGHAPAASAEFQNRIARIGRAGLDQMRKRNVVGKAGNADAAGIDHQAPVASRTARAMWVWAQRISDCEIPSASFSIASSDDILTAPSGITVSSQ